MTCALLEFILNNLSYTWQIE